MKVLDLFCGTKSIANAFEAAGHEVYTVDWNKQFNPTLCADIGTLTKEDIIELCGGEPDIVWMSPDCTTYSIAGIRFHRRKTIDGRLEAISDYAKRCDEINAHIIDLVISDLKPKFYFIENPRGCFRKMDFVEGLPRYTVTYCQYGDVRQKPTDIFTNHPNPCFKPACKRGASCHQAAPRGSKTGTQGLKNKIDRAKIPQELCNHIVDICESEVDRG